MQFFRWAILLLLLSSIACFVAYMATSQDRYKRWGLKILTWTLLPAFAFFAVLIVQRLA